MDVFVYEENTAFQQILDTYFDKNCLRAAVAKKKQIKWSLFPWIGTQDQAQATRSLLNLRSSGRMADEREIGSFCRLREKLLPFLLKRQANPQESGCYTKVANKGKKNFFCRYFDQPNADNNVILNDRQGIAWFRLLFFSKV